MDALFHIVARRVWQAALADGEYRAESLDQEGFVHCCFAAQLEGVANRLYRDVDDLRVVEIDPACLSARVVVEDSYGGGTEFPHVYGPIPVSAAVAVHELIRRADGRYRITVPGAAGSASTDR